VKSAGVLRRLLITILVLSVLSWFVERTFDRFVREGDNLVAAMPASTAENGGWELDIESGKLTADGNATRLAAAGSIQTVRYPIDNVQQHGAYIAQVCLAATGVQPGEKYPYVAQAGFVYVDADEKLPMRARPHVLTLVTTDMARNCYSAGFPVPDAAVSAFLEVAHMGGQGTVVFDTPIVYESRISWLYTFLHWLLLLGWAAVVIVLIMLTSESLRGAGWLLIGVAFLITAVVLVPKESALAFVKPYVASAEELRISVMQSAVMQKARPAMEALLPDHLEPMLGSKPMTSIQMLDVGHLVVFFLLALIASLAVFRRYRFDLHAWFTLIISLLLACLLFEFMQLFTNSRGFALEDIHANLVGALIGLIFAVLLFPLVAMISRRPKRDSIQ
jgi:VanZ family protein